MVSQKHSGFYSKEVMHVILTSTDGAHPKKNSALRFSWCWSWSRGASSVPRSGWDDLFRGSWGEEDKFSPLLSHF